MQESEQLIAPKWTLVTALSRQFLQNLEHSEVQCKKGSAVPQAGRAKGRNGVDLPFYRRGQS
jgi:hypothetical protein